MVKELNPLVSALKDRNPSLALHFVQVGENVNVTDDHGNSALMKAVGYKDVFQAIVEKKPDIGAVNDKGETVLHIIALGGSVAELAYMAELISKPGEIDRQNKDGNSPLFLSVSNNGVFEELINLNADLYLKNNNGGTILHRIAEVGTAADLHLLSKHEFDFNCQDNRGNTPLHIAASYGDGEIIEMLIQLGADVDARNSDGKTPLHSAIDSNFYSFEVEDHVRAIRILIENGADIQAVTNGGKTPLQIAQKYIENSTHSKFKTVLLGYGAK